MENNNDRKAAEDAASRALARFEKEAAGALGAFRALTADMEERVMARATDRAREQSAVMVALEARLEKIETKLLEIDARGREYACELRDVANGLRSVTESVTGACTIAADAMVACRCMEAVAGDRFGKRLDVLAAQVVHLIAIGKRLAAVEAKTEESGENHRAQQQEINGLHDLVELLERQSPARPTPKKV